jgi:hypothetical protein
MLINIDEFKIWGAGVVAVLGWCCIFTSVLPREITKT